MIEKSDLLRQVGSRIKKIRMSAGIQQVLISQDFQCAPSKISSIEKGARDPGTDFYHWFAERTGCSLDYIIRGEEYQQFKPVEKLEQSPDIKDAIGNLIEIYFKSLDYKEFINNFGKGNDAVCVVSDGLTEREKQIIIALRLLKDKSNYSTILDFIFKLDLDN